MHTSGVSDEVNLRQAREDDLPRLEEMTRDPEKKGDFQWTGWTDPRRWQQRWAENGLCGPDSGIFIVICGEQWLGQVTWRKQRFSLTANWWEIGVTLLPEFRGKGYGTRAQRLLTRYLFAHTTVHRICAFTEVENIAEQRSLEKAGFTREGVFREAHWRDGAWRSAVIYSVLRSDPLL
jgi:RimJ/RimL family protein N-acetyltransferase